MTLELVAKDYLAQGLSIIPIKGKLGRDVDDAKRPLIPWEEFQNRRAISEEIRQWFTKWPQADLAVVTGPISDLFIIDLDGNEWREAIADKEFPLTPVAKTTRGGYHYWCKWSPLLREYVTNRARIMPGVDVRGLGGYAVVPPSQGFNGTPYSWVDGRSLQDCDRAQLPEWIFSYLSRKDSQRRNPQGWISEALSKVHENSHNRNETFTAIAGRLHREHWSAEDILALLLPHADKCSFDRTELERIIESVSRYAAPVSGSVHRDNTSNIYARGKRAWPQDLTPAAFHGLAGEVVKTILPDTEADPSGLLLNFLVAFSSVIGRNPHYVVSGAKNNLNIFGLNAGSTAEGRKGVSWGSIREIFKAHDADWIKDNLASGLSSGEGLIWRIRDAGETPIETQGTARNKTAAVDSGVSDKRVLVVEHEFSRVLKAIGRDHSTLSAIIRDSFDTGTLSTLTKTPYKATGASIAIIGFITPQELTRNLLESEMCNGFANRFLFNVVRKSKSLPDGGNLSTATIQQLARKLNEASYFAQTVGKMTRDNDAGVLWLKVYDDLGRQRPGMFGAIVARGQAQVARLSCLYALLDHSTVVRAEHLRAALAVWDRVEASVRYIFGRKTGDGIADAILAALESQIEMDQTDVYNLFGGNKRAERIAVALSMLQEYGLVKPRKETGTGGRPRVLWSLVTKQDDTE